MPRTVTVSYDSPLGPMTLAAVAGPQRAEGVLTGCWFDGQRHDRAGLGTDARALGGPDAAQGPQAARSGGGAHGAPGTGGAADGGAWAVLAQALAWLDAYFAGRDPGPRPALAAPGTRFQHLVWDELLTLPRGSTRTYGGLARDLEARTGRRCAARAVGGAVARNPVSVIVPCHRVLGADGSLTGYAGGSERKAWLLRLEGVALPVDGRLAGPVAVGGEHHG
ncbi:methylated-DNA--[protein]-cysteine S-methyltransferase [Actinomyces sp. W5033]|uniref:methylated-DNA--[protein]-cysteine S-methyltransferase n=1 Tax=Actinomyces sp. W5033 TaxID=3446479 RepID=UPI003EDEA67E